MSACSNVELWPDYSWSRKWTDAMRLKLCGRFWRLVFQRGFRKKHDCVGICEGPHIKNKRIIIDADVTGELLLEVLIHEQLHACFWNIDEEDISQAANDIARNLTKLGWRHED